MARDFYYNAPGLQRSLLPIILYPSMAEQYMPMPNH